MSRWMRANGEAIYGTNASPFADLPWGRCTQKPGTLYLQVFDWPKDGALRVEAVDNDTLIHLPADAPDPVVSVIRVELAR